jgi:hypothetical protein
MQRNEHETTTRTRGHWSACLLAFVLGVATSGTSACNQSDFGDDAANTLGGADAGDDGNPNGPGQGARDEEKVACDSDDECIQGEACVEGVCQMPRCKDGPYLSEAPMKAGLKFFSDKEILVADPVASEGRYYVDGYAPEAGGIEYPGSWNVASTRIVDLAGGDFFGEPVELFAFATEGSTEIEIGGVEQPIRIDVGFAPVALAAGDVDRDRIDEVVALGRFGNVALCRVKERSCSSFIIQNANGIDVTMGDVDGDGYEEVVLLLEQGGTELIFVWQADPTGDDDFYAETGHAIERIDAGDLDGDGIAEVVGFASGGWLSDAKLHTYTALGQVAHVQEQVIADGARDIALADIDMDDQDEVLLLREGRTIELFEAHKGSHALEPVMTHELQVSADPDRIDASDFDGDSPRTRLMNDEGTLLSGPITPTIVAYFPPYDAERSSGLPSLFLGDGEITSESFSDTISLRAGIDIGVSASLFDLFKVSLGTRVSAEVSETMTTSTTYNIGHRMITNPNPDMVGYDYGIVMLSCACYHAYYYEVHDPNNRLGSAVDREQFVMVLPVGGTTTVWSSKRYNAMAERVGNLPIVEIPYVIGDPSSYPAGPEKADGSPIATDDFVFPKVPSLLVSDVTNVGFWLSVGEMETNEVARSTSIDVYGELGLGGFKFGATAGAGWGHSHAVTVGEEAIFAGFVPPIFDNPATPEDEYLEYAFAFSPFVYREHYTDDAGNDAGYYVMSFAVAR